MAFGVAALVCVPASRLSFINKLKSYFWCGDLELASRLSIVSFYLSGSICLTWLPAGPLAAGAVVRRERRSLFCCSYCIPFDYTGRDHVIMSLEFWG